MADEMANNTVIKSEDIAIFVKGDTNYFRLSKTTELEITSDTETEEKKFIADKNTTVFSKSTTLSLTNDLYTIKGEDDYEFFYNKWKKLVEETPEAVEVLIVFKAHGNSTEGYDAWQSTDTQIVFSSYNAVDSTLNFDFNFGTITLGKVKIASGQPTFTAGE